MLLDLLTLTIRKKYRIVEIPSSLLGMYLMDKLGRRPTITGCLIISGLSCLVTGLSPEGKTSA